MNYRHIYHAGNFADVFKHIALIEVIEYYKKKDAPFLVLDAFAGIGEYDISDEHVQKTSEMQNGILKLLRNKEKLPKEFDKYISIVEGNLKYNAYPGSPVIIDALLREQDRMVCSELHPEDFLTLKNLIPSAHNIDAYHAVRAFTPPAEKRGIIFLDPPFEKTDEFDKLLTAIAELHRRFRQATIIIWYPIKNEKDVRNFHSKIRTATSCEYVISELELKSSEKLFKTGLAIINPTWGLEVFLKKVSSILKKML
jgi:23S rRNA (adenine2030-N6)-methyltransferase